MSPNIISSISIAGVNVDIIDGPVGISHSGGADSGMLLYVVMKYVPGPIHVFTCSSQEKNNVAPKVALNVILKCMELTGRTDIFHHTFFVKSQTHETLLTPISDSIKKNNLQAVYTGATAFPPIEVMQQFNNDIPKIFDRRDPSKIRPFYSIENSRYYTPLYNVDKKKIFEMYCELGILETIFPLTRSCESFTLTEGHCGECWWCEERQWAFGKV